ncbi:MAG: hypothetical protein JSR41_07880 [Proteobacteria bacterium]|nr:hypothetical protein [Pseudomonadota bacterium]
MDSFKREFRDECLKAHWFQSTRLARAEIAGEPTTTRCVRTAVAAGCR